MSSKDIRYFGAPCSGGSKWSKVEERARKREEAPTAWRRKQVKRCSGYNAWVARIYKLLVVASAHSLPQDYGFPVENCSIAVYCYAGRQRSS